MQAGGTRETKLQKEARDRWRYVVKRYNETSAVEKARWAAANPEYNSFLYGYNFWMLEGLQGAGPEQYPQMIKSIQVIKDTMSKTGNTGFVCATVDPTKTVILINGNSFVSDLIQTHQGTMGSNSEETINLSPNIDPSIAEVIVRGSGGYSDVSEGTGQGNWSDVVMSFLSASQVKIQLPNLGSGLQFPWSVQVIEHKAQTVYPVLVSIAAELITMAWPVEPTVDAEISITVVEYL